MARAEQLPLGRGRRETPAERRRRIRTRELAATRLGPPDGWLLGSVGLVAAFGLMAVYSASFAVGLREFNNPYYFFTRQAAALALGIGAFVVTYLVDYRVWKRFALWGLLIAYLGLILVWHTGDPQYGASRWLQLGPLPAWQPSEFAKLALVIYLASWLEKQAGRRVGFVRWALPFGITVGGLVGLILFQPDLGTAVMVGTIALGMVFLAGLSAFQIGFVGLAGLAVVGLLAVTEGYRARRLAAFKDPWADPQGIGFQIVQSLIALGSGGLFGRGFGASRQKFAYVPGAHTDAIFAIVAEELGLVGGLFLLSLLGFVGYRCLRVGLNAPDRFGMLLAGGVATWLVGQTFVNVGGVTHLIPLAGIPLPLVSYGGSALVVTLAALGIVANISRHRPAAEADEDGKG
ncbi:MAG: putative lipid II flippase FtsW [Chloroflexota bacterium]